MSVGRNDPCPCGSGKKYKKCCQPKDEEAERAREEEAIRAKPAASPAPAAESSPRPQAPPLPDPRLAAWDERWEEFEAADYEEQVALFTRTLDEPGLMDGEMAFEMLNELYHQAVERQERDRFDALVAKLRERSPDVYAEEAHYLLDFLLTNALAAGRREAIPALARELAERADEDIDLFNNAVDQLAYHGHLSTLVEMMRLAWPKVQRSDEIISWGIEEFAERAADFEVFEYVEHHPRPDAHDPALRERLEPYVDFDLERLASFLAHLTGQAARPWTLSDFTFAHRRRPARQGRDEAPEGAQNLYYLSAEFLGYLRREEGVPYPKGELARKHLQRFILERHAGELEEGESLLESEMRPRRRRPKTKPVQPEHALCPDRARFDRYLAGLIGFINPQHYDVAATFELTPAWLRFLQSRQLIDAKERVQTLEELSDLQSELLKLVEGFAADPSLPQAIERWGEEAERELPG
jgi:hypothetical protein